MADEATERITILLQARDRDFARAMDRNNKLIAKLERDTNKNMSGMSRSIDSSLARASMSIRTFAGGVIGTILVGAIAKLTTGARAAIDQIGDLADRAARIDIDVESFQGLERGFQLFGVDAAAFGQSMEIFTQRLGEAAAESGELYKALEANGVSLRDQNGEIRPTLELLREFAGVISNTSSNAERLALANDAFGRSGRAMVLGLAEGPRAIDDMISSAREGGYILDQELVGRAEELGDRFDDLTRKVSNFFKTIIVEGADTIVMWTEMTSQAEAAYNAAEKALSLLPGEDVSTETIQEYQSELLDVLGAYQMVALQASDLSLALDRLGYDFAELGDQAAVAQIAELAEEMRDLQARLDEGSISAEDFDAQLRATIESSIELVASVSSVNNVSFGGVMEALSRLGNSLFDARSAALALRAALPAAPLPMTTGNPLSSSDPNLVAPYTGTRPEARPTDIDFGYSGPASGSGTSGPTGGGGGGGAAQVNQFQALLESTNAEIAKLQAEAAELIAVAESGVQVGDALEYARKKADLLYAAQEDGREITPELRAEIDALALAYVNAGESADEAADRLDRVAENAERGAEALTDIFGSVIDGSMSAKDAIASLLIEMAKVQAQQAFLGLMGTGGATNSIFSAIGSMLTGRAGGGGVEAGQAYHVNENTPNSEVFVPSRSGAVLNVAQAKSALSTSQGQAPAQVYIVPSPYFDARVDDRATARAQVVTGVGIAAQSRGLRGQVMSQDQRYG